MDIMAIYKTGSPNLQTTVRNGLCTFSGVHREGGEDFTIDEYLEYLGPDFVCIPLETALDQIHEVQEKTYIKSWEEITENDWDYALGVLPPEKWKTVGGVNIFRMSEYMIGNITAHYASYDNRYFMAYRRSSDSYEILSTEVLNLHQLIALGMA